MTSVTFAGRKQEESPNPLFTRCLRHLHHDVFSLFAAGSSPPMWWAKVGQTFKFFVIKIDLSRVLFWLKVLKNSFPVLEPRRVEKKKQQQNGYCQKHLWLVKMRDPFRWWWLGTSRVGKPADDGPQSNHRARKKKKGSRNSNFLFDSSSHVSWMEEQRAGTMIAIFMPGGEKAHKEKTPKVRKNWKEPPPASCEWKLPP